MLPDKKMDDVIAVRLMRYIWEDVLASLRNHAEQHDDNGLMITIEAMEEQIENEN